MTGVFKLPVSSYMTPEQALDVAKDDDLTDVMIIGYDQQGKLVIRSSRMTCAEGAFLANKAFHWSMNGGEHS